jgi:HAD superfamily hydrolase (TIGR01509 family)
VLTGRRGWGPRIEAVVFDLDGTLLDTMTVVPAAYAATIRALGGPPVAPADVVATWHIGPMPVVLAHFLGRPVGDADVECFHRHAEAATAAVRPLPGVPEALDGLAAAGHRLGVFTSATRRGALRNLAAAGLDRRFAAVVCGDEVDRPKPAPDGLLAACRRLGASAAATAYVGDAEVDIRCAEAAGALPVHAAWDAPAPIAGCRLVAHHPDDLSTLLARR